MHNVGDTIWIISTERPGVLPFLVVEEVTKKSIKGTETIFMVQIPGDDRAPQKLSKISGEVYSKKADAKKALMSRAEKAIDDMLKKGQQLIDRQTDDSTDATEDIQAHSSKLSDEKDFDGEYVTLPDGTKAKVNFKGVENDI